MKPPRFGSIARACGRSVAYTSLSQWWFISTRQSGQVIFFLVSATGAPSRLESVKRYLLTAVTQCLCHPDKLFQELVDAPDVGLIKKIALSGKRLLHAGEIYISENR